MKISLICSFKEFNFSKKNKTCNLQKVCVLFQIFIDSRSQTGNWWIYSVAIPETDNRWIYIVASSQTDNWWIYIVDIPETNNWWIYMVAIPQTGNWWIYNNRQCIVIKELGLRRHMFFNVPLLCNYNSLRNNLIGTY